MTERWFYPERGVRSEGFKVRELEPGGTVIVLWYRGRSGGRSRYHQQKLDGVRIRRRRGGRPHPDDVAAAVNAARRAIADRNRAAERAAVTDPTWQMLFRRFAGTDDLAREARMWVPVFERADVRPTAKAQTIQGHLDTFQEDRYEGRIDAHGNPVDDPMPMRSRRAAESDVRYLKVATRWASGKRAVRRRSKVRKRPWEYLPPPDPAIIPADPLDDYAPERSDPMTMAACEDRYRHWLGKARRHRTGPYGHRRSWLYEMIVLANATGKRIGSIRQLRIGDLHLDDRDLAERPFGTITWPAKYDKISREWNRVPILTRRARRAIERTLRRLERYELPMDDGAWLFPSVNGAASPVSKKTAGDWLRWADRDLDDLRHNTKRWHSLRAKWATERKDRANQVDVAWIGGWKDVATLQRWYQKIEPERAFAAAA